MQLIKYFEAFLLTFFFVFLLTPLFIKIAFKYGIVDQPGPRRVNQKPIPRLGGPAIFAGFMIGFLIMTGLSSVSLPVIIGGCGILILGVFDDIKGVSAIIKLWTQILIATVVYIFGIRIDYITSPFGSTDILFLPKILSFVFTILWIVGITNTLNLIDGLDGLAAGVTCIASLTLFLVAVQKGQSDSALLSVCIAGAASGFLRWNFHPAKTFMGDSGALFLGFIMSVISITGAFKSTTAVTFLIPILVLGIPIFDTSFAIFRRLKTHSPVMSQPDKEHLHHKLLAIGLGHSRVVIFIYLATLLLGLLSFFLIRELPLAIYLISFIIIIAVLLILIGKIKKLKLKPN